MIKTDVPLQKKVKKNICMFWNNCIKHINKFLLNDSKRNVNRLYIWWVCVDDFGDSVLKQGFLTLELATEDEIDTVNCASVTAVFPLLCTISIADVFESLPNIATEDTYFSEICCETCATPSNLSGV